MNVNPPVRRKAAQAVSHVYNPDKGTRQPAPPTANQLLQHPVLQRGFLSLADKPGSACVFHRVTMPYMLADIRPKVPVFVVNRLPAFDISAVKALKAKGVKIVVDMDDDMVLGPDHPLYTMYKEHGLTERIQQCVELADLVTVTNTHLADALKDHATRIEILPNALPFDQSIFTKSPDTESGTPFVYCGGATHRPDLALIKAATNHGQDVTIAGYDPENAEWAKIKAQFYRANYENVVGLLDFRNFMAPGDDWSIMGLTFHTDALRSKFINAAPHPDYVGLLDGHRCALAPLVDNPFNRSKSNLKVLEAGAKGIPIITSKVHPYLNDVDKDVVLYAADSLEWRKHMRRIKESPAYAQDMGAQLAEHVRKHYHLDTVNALRKSIIESL